MDLRRAASSGPVVNGVGASGFRVGDLWFDRALLLTSASAIGAPLHGVDDISDDVLHQLRSAEPAADFLLLGTGARLEWPSPSILARIDAHVLGVEVMDSRAAARAWGMLRSEGRTVVGILLPLTNS